MTKDDAGFLNFFEDEPIVESGETIDEERPDMSSSSKTEEIKDEKHEEPSTEEEQLSDSPKEENDPTETNLTDEEKDTKRYEYWQGKHDKLVKDMDVVKSQSEINKDYAPIAEYLYQNPQALLKLQEQLAESAPQESTPQIPTAPEKPERPANYSRYDGMQDAESASAKYDEALMSYNSNMLDYMNTKQIYNEQQQYAQMQRTAEQERVVRKQEAFKADLLANGLKSENYNDFVKKVNGAESMDPKNLIAYYKILAGTGITKSQLQAEEFARQQARVKNNPPPAGSEGGEPTAVPSDDDAFNNDMLNWKR